MSRSEQIPIERHLTPEGINLRIKSLEKDTKVLKRLYFITYRYEGHGVEEAAQLVCVSHNTAYIWQRRWNEFGYEGLIPKYAGGKPSKLSDCQKEQLEKRLREQDNWTTNEVRNLIFDEFKVEYSLKQIRMILKKCGMKYAKPYPHDFRKPTNAEEVLKKLGRDR